MTKMPPAGYPAFLQYLQSGRVRKFASRRYDAACSAALAGCSGNSPAKINDETRIHWRTQAMDWLRAELAGLDGFVKAHPEDRGEVRRQLLHWQRDIDLAGLRDPGALAKLPGKEREACRALWAKVESILLGMADDFNGNTEKRVDRSDSVLLFVREITTQSILNKLDWPIAMAFPNEFPLEDVLRYITQATATPNSSGIPIYVDPLGLQEADKTITSLVSIDLDGVPLRVTLRLALQQLGLVYQVRDGVLIITSLESADATIPEPKSPVGDAMTARIIEKLDQPIAMSFPNETPLEDVLKYIKQATQGPNDSGIPLYVDPLGLVEADKTMNALVSLDLEGVPLKTTLRLLLKQLGLAYQTKDGVLIITSEESVDATDPEPRSPVGDARTKKITEKLGEPIPMSFMKETRLEDVLKYIKKATSDPNHSGIPIYVDPLGLQEADKTMTSPVVIDLEGVPLRMTLRLALKQLGLVYQVRNGVLIITSEESADAANPEPKTPGDDARTQAILNNMEAPVPMLFPDGVPLGNVIKRIKAATVSPMLKQGIPIYVDPVGLQKAEKSESSPVKINVEGVPLKKSLKLVLDQVGLTYTVEDGLIVITSKTSKE